MERVEKIFVSGKLGKTIRKARKTRNITQEDLANTLTVEHKLQISSTYISWIERGSDQFNKEKIEAICSYLNVDIDKVNELPTLDVTVDSMVEQLKMLEVEMVSSPDEALEKLRQYEQIHKHIGTDNEILHLFVHYLRGRYAVLKELSLEQALQHFEQAIFIAQSNPDLKKYNLLAGSCYQISRLYYYGNKLAEALYYIEKGFKTFSETGERTYLYYLLCINKACVWKKQKKHALALSFIEGVSKDQSYLIFSDAKLNLYQLRVELLIELNRFSDSIPIAQEGLDLARLDGNHDRQYDFLSSLGEAHAKLGSLSVAEQYYNLSSKLEDSIKKKFLAITTYTSLGQINMNLGNYPDAEKALEKAVILGEEYKDDYRLCEALVAQGELFHKKGKDKRALTALQKAHTLATKLSIDHVAKKVLILLTEISLRSKLPESEQYMQSLLKFLITDISGGNSMYHSDPPDS